MINQIWAELSAYSIPELVAVLASLLYIVLAARNNRHCWPAAFVASNIFVIVLWQHRLLMDAALNVYYAAMAIYGWHVWQVQDTSNDRSPQASPIRSLALTSHWLAIAAIAALSLVSGYWLDGNTDAAFPFLDSLTSWASLYATWLLAHRVLDNWLYWIPIDGTRIYVYVQKELFFTAALFALYTAMALYAYVNWRRIKKQAAKPAAPAAMKN
ncbi:MAG: nicotinamide riboside transporter PnuC [Pseudomonadales bacterium]